MTRAILTLGGICCIAAIILTGLLFGITYGVDWVLQQFIDIFH